MFLAGFTFLFYIAIGITSMVLFRQATSGEVGMPGSKYRLVPKKGNMVCGDGGARRLGT